jgi:hypothetical protein
VEQHSFSPSSPPPSHLLCRLELPLLLPLLRPPPLPLLPRLGRLTSSLEYYLEIGQAWRGSWPGWANKGMGLGSLDTRPQTEARLPEWVNMESTDGKNVNFMDFYRLYSYPD